MGYIMIVRIRGGQRGGRRGGGIRSWTEAERAKERECVYLSFSSPDSDREQTTEDNEKQIFGGEEGAGGEAREEELVGRREEEKKKEGRKKRGKGEERGE